MRFRTETTQLEQVDPIEKVDDVNQIHSDKFIFEDFLLKKVDILEFKKLVTLLKTEKNDVSTENILDMMSYCYVNNLVSEAKQIYLEVRDLESFQNNAAYLVVIRTLLDNNAEVQGMSVFKDFLTNPNVKADGYFLMSVVKGIAKKGNTEKIDTVRDIFDYLEIEMDATSFHGFIEAYIACKNIDMAIEMFHIFLERREIIPEETFALLVVAWCRKRQVGEAKKIIDIMLARHIKPKASLFTEILLVCADIKDISLARKIMEMMRIKKIPREIENWNAMIFCYTSCLMIKEAKRTMKDMKGEGFNPDNGSYYPLLKYYVRQKDLMEVQKLFFEMRQNDILLDSKSWKIVVEVYARNGKLLTAFKMIDIMKTLEVPIERQLEHILLTYCKKTDQMTLFVSRFGKTELATRALEELEKNPNYGKSKRSIYKPSIPGFNPRDWKMVDDPFSNDPNKQSLEKYKDSMDKLSEDILTDKLDPATFQEIKKSQEATFFDIQDMNSKEFKLLEKQFIKKTGGKKKKKTDAPKKKPKITFR